MNLIKKIISIFKIKHRELLLEQPIQKNKDDLFGVSSYVNSIIRAQKDGARFIAIDGDFGSGKSSIINLLKSKTKHSNVTYVTVNSLYFEEKDVTPTQNYHKYFINQFANDVIKNPTIIERIFYKSFIEYTTIKQFKNSKIQLFLDNSLHFLVSLFIIFTVLYQPLKDILSVLGIDLSQIIILLLLFGTLIAITRGIVLVKPENQNDSPLLEVDKCRNNFLKILEFGIRKNSTLVFIIDDLD